MIDEAQNILPEERGYVRLTDTLPLDTDIYISFSTLPEAKCGLPPVSSFVKGSFFFGDNL